MIKIENPYSELDWETCHYVHSMSHQHCSGSAAECEAFYEMGYRHFAFSNYYPSMPVTSLPKVFKEQHPDVIFSPNAEQHSFTDTGLHFNGLGSLFSSGYGSSVAPSQLSSAPLVASFNDLHADANDEQAGKSIYRLDINVQAKGENPEKNDVAATLTIDGAVQCDFADSSVLEAELREWPLTAGKHQIYLRTEKSKIIATLDYDRSQLEVGQFRLMQGTNRPWREVFSAVLDGEMIDGQREGGLQYAEGGGITLNHPLENVEHYLPMLDFDPRVLGIEVWNYRRGFGAPQYYELWDEILRTGRRCWGFFVKDHRAFERGRNVLVLPNIEGLSPEEKERAALRAYRNGTFFGSVASSSTNEAGEMTTAFDKSEFRFTRIAVQRDDVGCPLAVAVSVAGQDVDKRPNIQLRFITAKGLELVVDAPTAEFSLKMGSAELLARRFIRVEAFAYPDTYDAGKSLSKESFGQMDVVQISSLEDQTTICDSNTSEKKQESPAVIRSDKVVSPWNSIGEASPRTQEPISVTDMIFSQPLRLCD